MKWLKKVSATPLSTIAKVIDSLDPIANDRANAPSIHAVREAINYSGQFIYPVGSIYMSVNNVNPHDIFGGTWQRIKDRFLLCSGDSYANGSIGGEAAHILTVDELATHEHNVVGGTTPLPVGDYIATSWQDMGVEATSPTTTTTRIDGGSSGLDIEGTAQHTGGGQAHNNMPPYFTVNVWYRTA